MQIRITHHRFNKSLAILAASSMVAFLLIIGAAGAEDPNFTPWPYLILGQVTDVKASAPDADQTVHYSYRVHVICEYRNALAVDSAITLSGDREDGGFGRSKMPAMGKGVYFVMPIEPTSNPQVFSYNLLGPHFCPVGVPLPSAVAEKEVTDLQTALTEYGRSLAQPMDHTRAIELSRSPNYFLWALGMSELAKGATQTTVGMLQTPLDSGIAESPNYTDEVRAEAATLPIVSLRQAIWLAHCLTYIVPKEVRPPSAEVELNLTDYLQRYVAANKEGFIGQY